MLIEMSSFLTGLTEGYLLAGPDPTHLAALFLKADLKQTLAAKEGVAESLSLGCLPSSEL